MEYDYKNLENLMIHWRHELHRHPEEAMKEEQTAEYVANELEKMGIEVTRRIGGTGVVGTLRNGSKNAAIGLRADMDALALNETADLPYKSQNAGWMHACGHDGHMSILLGAAKYLADTKDFDGTVHFVFQPGEEPGIGAKAMLEDRLFERFPMDEIYGMHNAPQFIQGTFKTRVGGTKASEDDFEIHIHGKGTHASTPHLGIDPIVIAAEIILALQTIVSRTMKPMDAVVVSCTDIKTDGIRNSIPSNVTIYGDCRTFKKENQDFIESQMRRIVSNICDIYGADSEVIYSREFIPTVNDASCVETAVAAAKKIVGEENVDGNCEPVTSSEDFAVYGTRIPSCYMFLGAGKDPDPTKNYALHNVHYDFNDNVLLNGAKYYAEIVREKLAKN